MTGQHDDFGRRLARARRQAMAAGVARHPGLVLLVLFTAALLVWAGGKAAAILSETHHVEGRMAGEFHPANTADPTRVFAHVELPDGHVANVQLPRGASYRDHALAELQEVPTRAPYPPAYRFIGYVEKQ